MNWYFELWCEKGFIHKSDMFETKEEAILQAEKAIEAEMAKEYEEKGARERGEYTYELYCTCEGEER